MTALLCDGHDSAVVLSGRIVAETERRLRSDNAISHDTAIVDAVDERTRDSALRLEIERFAAGRWETAADPVDAWPGLVVTALLTHTNEWGGGVSTYSRRNLPHRRPPSGRILFCSATPWQAI